MAILCTNMPPSSNKKKQMQISTNKSHTHCAIRVMHVNSPSGFISATEVQPYGRHCPLSQHQISPEFEGKGHSTHTETGGHQRKAKWSKVTFTVPNKPSEFETSCENLLSQFILLPMGRYTGWADSSIARPKGLVINPGGWS